MSPTEKHIYLKGILDKNISRTKLIEKMACEFSNLIRQRIGSKNMADLIVRNREYRAQNTDACASHEFCDPEQYMIHILALNGYPVKFLGDPESEYNEYKSLYNDTWRKARKNEFRVSISD